MKVWVKPCPGTGPWPYTLHADRPPLHEPAFSVRLLGTEGKLLVAKEDLRDVLVLVDAEAGDGVMYRYCQWHDCSYQEVYADRRRHDGTCPLREEE
jgi:hypothetical protein